METPTSFLRKSGPVKTGPTGPAPTPMYHQFYLNADSITLCQSYLSCIRPHLEYIYIYIYICTVWYPYLAKAVCDQLHLCGSYCIPVLVLHICMLQHIYAWTKFLYAGIMCQIPVQIYANISCKYVVNVNSMQTHAKVFR